MDKNVRTQLTEEILRARTRVYHVGEKTPLQKLPYTGSNYEIFIKREDLGPINAYKWRGAYNAVSVHKSKTGCETVVAASAGNHAQGVALAASKLGIKAKIFMPLPTPMMKRVSVERHGGENVEIILTGDTYDESSKAAKKYCEKNNYTYIHPFDDIYTIAGQATIADEIMLSDKGPFDIVFIQIGGGGMAAAVSAWLKIHQPNIKIIGVEGEGQASMIASIKAKKPVTLESIDTFCDGTAVVRPGDLTFEVCKEYIDDFMTVSNEEVSAAIQTLWDTKRVIPEPSGAMGLAGLVKYANENPDAVKGKKMLCIIGGANMDFSKLSLIAQQSAVGAHRRRYLRFHLGEKKGGLLGLLDSIFTDVNVSEFLYGKTDEKEAWPVIAFEAAPERMEQLEKDLNKAGIPFEDVTQDADIRYRIISYNPAIFKNPLLMHIHFPERRGALRDFLRKTSTVANVCYFNYAYSGEAIGRALMGFEFESKSDQDKFHEILKDTVVTAKPVDENTAKRILSRG
jgi:threonine dehydratase